ncbi:MAG: alkaline phosphatase family protein, partial [Candidatus Lokiarchaeia archaeon]|nr:alkaline phosphatase family protein [Candidatus Lokiarchaeia archaeon]
AFEIKKKLFLKKLKEDFELFVFVIRIPDGITHHSCIRLSKTNDYIKEGYVKIDEFIGEILKRNDIDNIFLISDHGLKTYSHEFNIKRFMEKKKILFYNSYLLNKVLSLFIKIFGFLNPRFFNTTYFHNKVIKFFENLNFVDKKRELIDPNNSRFIHFYSNYGGIYLSDKDKSKKEYLKKILLKDKNIDRVILYDSNSMPDIILILKSKYLFSVKDSFFTMNRAYSFNHSDKGLFAAIGKNIKKGKKNEIFYLNFAPTILKLFNVQKPFHMKGEALDILK